MGFSLNNNLAYIIYETHVSNNLMRKPISYIYIYIYTLTEIYISYNLIQKQIL